MVITQKVAKVMSHIVKSSDLFKPWVQWWCVAWNPRFWSITKCRSTVQYPQTHKKLSLWNQPPHFHHSTPKNPRFLTNSPLSHAISIHPRRLTPTNNLMSSHSSKILLPRPSQQEKILARLRCSTSRSPQTLFPTNPIFSTHHPPRPKIGISMSDRSSKNWKNVERPNEPNRHSPTLDPSTSRWAPKSINYSWISPIRAPNRPKKVSIPVGANPSKIHLRFHQGWTSPASKILKAFWMRMMLEAFPMSTKMAAGTIIMMKMGWWASSSKFKNSSTSSHHPYKTSKPWWCLNRPPLALNNFTPPMPSQTRWCSIFSNSNRPTSPSNSHNLL